MKWNAPGRKRTMRLSSCCPPLLAQAVDSGKPVDIPGGYWIRAEVKEVATLAAGIGHSNTGAGVLVGPVDVVVSRFLYYWTLRKLDMSVFAVALAASPVAAVLWSQLLFDVFPTPQQLLGGAAILCGVAVVTSAPILERRMRRSAADVPSGITFSNGSRRSRR